MENLLAWWMPSLWQVDGQMLTTPGLRILVCHQYQETLLCADQLAWSRDVLVFASTQDETTWANEDLEDIEEPEADE